MKDGASFFSRCDGSIIGHFEEISSNKVAADIYIRLGLTFENMRGQSVWGLFPEMKGTIIERELRSAIKEHREVSFEFCPPKINVGTKQRDIQRGFHVIHHYARCSTG